MPVKRWWRLLHETASTEEGRIGYVAVMRARNLFVLAVPKTCLGQFESELIAKGFKKHT
jgi:hypothetical protein